MNIVNVGYRSANYWVIQAPGGRRLLVDCGWPGMYGALVHELKRKSIQPREIDLILVTHFHPDHAGCVQELKDTGARLLLIDLQAAFVEALGALVKPDSGYLPIRLEGTVHASLEEAGRVLRGIGVEGSVVHTPGHSDDSVSLVLAGGEAFVGDLQPEGSVMADDTTTRSSWSRLREAGAKTIYPAHGPIWSIAGLRR